MIEQQPDPDTLAGLMGRVPHFKDMPAADLLAIVRAGWLERKADGQHLFWEDDPCAGLFVLLQGGIHLYKHGPEGQEYILSALQPVTMFNEVAVLDEGPNPVTAIANGKTLLWHAECQDFRALIRQYAQIAFGLLPILARRNRWLMSQYEDLCFLTVRARTAKLLLEFSQHGAEQIDRRDLRIQEMAARIFTSPDVVSRTLGLLDTRGMIATDRQSIRVLDSTALAKLAHLDPDFEK